MTKRKLNILLYSLDKGGAERVASILVNKLHLEYDLTLVLMNKTISYQIPENINIIYLDNGDPKEKGIIKILKIFFLAYKYGRICKRYMPDCTLSFMNRPNYINVLSKIFGNSSRVLISERIAPSKEYETGSLKDKISRTLIKLLYPYADCVIPNAQGIAKDLRDNFNINRKICVINNPIDITKVNELKREEDFNDSPVDYTPFTFITVGRLHPQKNQLLMLEAMSKITHDVQLLIIGEGELRELLEMKIKDLKLQDKVFLLGNQSNPFKYLKQADCFIFSSNYEGFPNVILEALSCELPIISTDCQTGPREILEDSFEDKNIQNGEFEVADFGILIPTNNISSLKNAMDEIYINKKLREELKSKSLQRVSQFDEKLILDKFKEQISNDG